MGRETGIGWTHHTFNPWRGCTKVSPGCAHCYAEVLSKRNPKVLGEWGPGGQRAIAAEVYWDQPLKWDRAAKAAGERRRVFCMSLGDVMEDRPELRPHRARLFALIQKCRNLDWLLLTKRPENFSCFLPWAFAGDAVRRPGVVWPQIWLGVSVEDQQRADERIPLLLKMPATIRFLSCEPLLGPIDLRRYLPRRMALSELPGSALNDGATEGRTPGIDWVIAGGESGAGARPMHPDWARSLRDQCQAAGVPYFFKQWGEWEPIGADKAATHIRIWPGRDEVSLQIGKKAAGRLLDGREWSEFPEVAVPH